MQRKRLQLTMWIRANPNPKEKEVVDCVVRAISIVLSQSWYEIYDQLCALGREECNMPSADAVWGKFLKMHGFSPFMISENCPECITIREFCKIYPRGRYIIGTGSHAVAVIDGAYYDSWDSGDETPSFFWHIS